MDGQDGATTRLPETAEDDNGDAGPEEASSAAPAASAVAAIEALAAVARNGRLQHRPHAVAVAVAVLTRWACFDPTAAVPALGPGKEKGKGKKGKKGEEAGAGMAAWGLPALVGAAGLTLGGLIEAVRASEGAADGATSAGTPFKPPLSLPSLNSHHDASSNTLSACCKGDGARSVDCEEVAAAASARLSALLGELGHMTLQQLATSAADVDSKKKDGAEDAKGGKGGNGAKAGEGAGAVDREWDGSATVLDVSTAVVAHLTSLGVPLRRAVEEGEEEGVEADGEGVAAAAAAAVVAMADLCPERAACLRFAPTQSLLSQAPSTAGGRPRKLCEALRSLVGQVRARRRLTSPCVSSSSLHPRHTTLTHVVLCSPRPYFHHVVSSSRRPLCLRAVVVMVMGRRWCTC